MFAPWWLCTPLHYPPPPPPIRETFPCYPPCPHPRRSKPTKHKLTPKDLRRYFKELRRADRARQYALWERYELLRLYADDLLYGDAPGVDTGGWKDEVMELYDDMRRAQLKKEKEKKGKKGKKAKDTSADIQLDTVNIYLRP